MDPVGREKLFLIFVIEACFHVLHIVRSSNSLSSNVLFVLIILVPRQKLIRFHVFRGPKSVRLNLFHVLSDHARLLFPPAPA